MATSKTQYSIGRNCSIVIVDPIAPGGQLQIDNLTAVDFKRKGFPISFDRLDGIRVRDNLPAGGSGSFMAERGNSAIQDYLAARDAIIDGGGASPDRATVFQYIQEQDGSVSTYQYNECAFGDAEFGKFQGDKTVSQTLPMTFGQMVRL